MAKPVFLVKVPELKASTRFTLRFPWLIVLLFVVLSAASLRYTIQNLGIRNNTAELLSQDLPFQQVRLKLEKAFPLDAAAIIIVIESETPEHTAMAADFVRQRLQGQPGYFDSAYIPDDNPFFRQQGFLYLDLDELEDLSDRLTDAQPFIGHLSQNYHVAGLVDIISLALEAEDKASTLPLEPLLSAIDRTLIKVKSKQIHFLSWQQLLTENSFDRDHTRRLVIAKPHLDFNALMPAQKPMAYLRGLVDEMAAEFPGVTLSFTGEVALEHEEMETVNQDMLVSGIVSLFLVCAALWLGLRSFRLLIATFMALIAGLILTAGFATLAIGHLNLISVAFAVLYIGLGVDFATHLCLHYQEKRHQGMATNEAILNSMSTVGRSLFLCALTTAIGFFAFIPTDFKGVSELGIISGVGMFIGLAVSLSLLPAILKIMPIQPLPSRNLAALPDWVYFFPFRHAKAIRIGALLLAVLAGLTLTRLTFDAASVNLRDPESPSVIAFKKLLKTKTDSPFVLSALADSLEQANRLADIFDRLPSVDDAVTLSHLVPPQQDEKLEIIDNLNLIIPPSQLDRFAHVHEQSNVRNALIKLGSALDQTTHRPSPNLSNERLINLRAHVKEFIQYADKQKNPADAYARLEISLFKLLPRTMLTLRDAFKATPFGIDDIPAYLRSHWISADGVYKVMIIPKHDLNSAEHLKNFVNQVLNAYPSVFGLPVGDVTSGQAVVKAFVQAFSSALVLIILLLLLMTRSLKRTLLVIAPLLLAALLTGASNVLLNNPFNFANIIVLPLLLGMGVDSGIHMMHRLQHQPDHATGLLRSSSARGVFFSSLTTFCSFTSLAFNSHVGTASMGMLLAVGIALTILCSLLVLPALSYETHASADDSCRLSKF